ncbi:MAG: CRISPR system precrRNA processing endoribonuclease RAMP protein Cas6 [Ktedonobacteraceae bacterium]|nr:CRISPR system precrRNA processing endoribonuclease RAMP protein Cas6 [Chloroflexota bacterium]
MDSAVSPAAPARLYAFLLKLRPLQTGTLMAFTGELVHGAWMDWMRSTAPDVSALLHEENRRRLFTCSSLLFPLPFARMRDAERRNVHLPLTPEQTYHVRITLLRADLFPLFHHALTTFSPQATEGERRSPLIQLGKQQFLLEEVIAKNEDATMWADWTSFADMIAQVQVRRPGRVETLKLEFASLTTFNRGSTKGASYGNYFARLPLPHMVFPGLAKRWHELAPPEVAPVIQPDLVERYIQDEGIVIDEYDLMPHTVKFTTHWQPGFIGTCTYALRGPDEPATEESVLTVRQQIVLLARLAFYCGVGYKTPMGMGQTRVVESGGKR